MPRSTGSTQLNLDLPPDLVADAKAEAERRGAPLTFYVRQFLEQFTGRKPLKSPAKRGRPRKLENS